MTDAVGEKDQLTARFHGQLGRFRLDVDLQAPLRGTTALFGPSGCGKTTILRCIAGLTRLPGALRLGSEIWQDDATGRFVATHKRRVGYVFQEPSLFPHLRVRENLTFGYGRAGRSGEPPSLKIDEVVDLLGLGRLLDRMPDALSGGERQRVAIGRALLSQPQLLLMDEPLAALDRTSKDEILPYFDLLQQRFAFPILYVSHDIAEVSRLAERMVLINEGRQIAVGPVSEMLERLDLGPATGRFEAGVVVQGQIVGHDLEYHLTRVDHQGQTITVPLVDAAPGDLVRLRILARDVALATRRPEQISFRNILEGRIADLIAEPNTAFAETLVDIGGGRLRARLTREAVAELGLVVGAPVFAMVKTVSFGGRAIGLGTAGEEGTGE